MNQIVNVTQDTKILLEYCYQDKIRDSVRVRNKDGIVVKKSITTDVDPSERRRGIGGILFEKRPEYQFPVIELSTGEAQRVLRAEKRDGTNNFRLAIPLKKKGE